MKRKKMALLIGLLVVILLSVALGLMLYFGVGSDKEEEDTYSVSYICLLYTSPSPRDPKTSRMPSSA